MTMLKVPGEESSCLRLEKNFIGPDTRQANERKKQLEAIEEEKILKEKNKKRRR